MDTTATPAPPGPPGGGALDPPGPPSPSVATDRILGGIAGLLAGRLGVDALWVRMVFVVLALVGGLGLLVYAGLWLALVVGADPDRTIARWLGAGVLVLAVPLAISAGDLRLMSGPVAVIGLLIGLTVALWQPRAAVPSGPPIAFPAPLDDDAADPPVPPRLGRAPMVLPRPTPRPRSILGRATLGIAVIVAAVGAMIDEANGGRLHPEQWLGAAAAVCGVGLLVGAVRGQARWLVLPAAAFAVSGAVAGVAAKAGIDAGHLTGDHSIVVTAGTGPGSVLEETAFGTVRVSVAEAPEQPVLVVARVGIGSVGIDTVPGVTIEVRPDLDHGAVRVNGLRRGGDGEVVVVGPAGPPDVIVEAHIERGWVNVIETEHPLLALPELPELPELPPVIEDGRPGSGRLEPIGDGVAATVDGWIVLAGGEVVIGPDDEIVAGDVFADGSTRVLTTTFGEFRLLPRSILLGPSGEVVDLTDVRLELAERSEAGAAPPSPVSSDRPPSTPAPTGG